MTILVTGGAGYVGSHTVHLLAEQGRDVTVLDNLIVGHRAAIHPKAKFVQMDLRDWFRVRELFMTTPIEGVIHFAARASVSESMKEPFLYFRDNVGIAFDLLQLCAEYKVKKFVFSSTSNVYGQRNPYLGTDKMFELLTPSPSSPYGETKLMVERVLHWMSEIYGMHYAALRYFNAAGAHPAGILGEDHANEPHLIPNIIRAAHGNGHIEVYGSDYPTPDGTAIRDYVHVMDLAEGHIVAYDGLGIKPDGCYNLGTGRGYSVKEVIAEVLRQVGTAPQVIYNPRRPGDPASLISDPRKAEQTWGWTTKNNLQEIIRDALKWYTSHPMGYGDKAVKRAGF